MSSTQWNLDPAHSQIAFKVKHMMISNVTGYFDNFKVNVSADDDTFKNASIDFEANINSINTNNESRDEHLKSPEFFDAAQFPTLSFKGTNYELKGEGEAELKGDLTIKGVTKPDVLSVDHLGIQKDPWGNTKTGFSINGKIKRSDFDLTWNAALETGGVMVSDEVKLNAEVQFVKGN